MPLCKIRDVCWLNAKHLVRRGQHLSDGMFQTFLRLVVKRIDKTFRQGSGKQFPTPYLRIDADVFHWLPDRR